MTTHAPEPPSTADDLREEASAAYERRWWILAALAIAQLMVVLDASIVNIALPDAQADLGFSVEDRQWVVTAYSLAFGGLLLLGGRLADLFGRKRVFVGGLIGFAVASVVAGAAVDFTMLVTARAAQGLFGALLTPAGLAVLTTTFTDPKERGRAFAIYGTLAGAGGGIGLLLGGVLTDHLSWRWCLYVNLFFAAAAAIGGALWLAADHVTRKPGLDLPGTLAATIGLFALVYGAANAETDGWSDPVTVVGLVAGVVLLALFVAIEHRSRSPLLPLRVLADRDRGGGLLAIFTVGAGLFAIFLFLTYYLQTSLGYSPTRTGLAFMPMVLGLIVTAQLSSAILRKLGARLPITAGLVVAAAGLLLLSRLQVDSGYAADILPGLVLVGLGAGIVVGPAIQTSVTGVAAEDASVASALSSIMQQVGGSIGTAVLSTVAATAATDYLTTHGTGPTAQALADVESYTTAFQWSAGIFLAGAVVCGLLLRSGTLAPAAEGTVVLAH